MGIFDDGYEQAIIDAARNPVTRPPAGFSEAFWATYEATRQEDLSISERQNYLDKVRKRNDIILDKTGGFLDSSGAPDPVGKLDLSDPSLTQPGQLSTTVERARLAYNKRIAELAARHPEVKTDSDLLAEIKEDSRRIREKTDGVLSNTTFSGKVGSFTGAMAASMTDPLVIATLPFGASASAGILRTALINAGLAATSEALIQPFVSHYKKELGSPYSIVDALERVAGAGVGAGVLSAGVKGLELGYKALRRPRLHGVDDLLETFDRNVTRPTLTEQDAAHVLGDYAEVMRENPFTLGDPVAAERHFQASAKAAADLDGGNPVEVQSFVMGSEPRPELRAAEETLRVKIIREAKPREASLDQSLGQFVKNNGGVAVDQAGDLRGEYDALFESGGRGSGAVKRKAGLSPDEMAQRAHQAGFIDQPDPVMLADALRGDLEGNKVYSIQGDRFERKLELQAERQYNAWVSMEEDTYHQALAAEAKNVLDQGDVHIPTGEVIERDGMISPVTRSAREAIAEAESDLSAGNILRDCLLKG